MVARCILLYILSVFMPFVFPGLLPGTVWGIPEGAESLRQINPRTYPDAHEVLAREIETFNFEQDGTYTDEDEVFITILDEQGRRSEKVQSFYVNRHYGTLKILTFEVIKADGRRLPVDLKRYSNTTAASMNSRMNIYDPDQKVIKVFVPDLEAGDSIHYKIRRIQFKPVIPGAVYAVLMGQYVFPVRHYTFRLIGPSDMKVYHLVKDPVTGTWSFSSKKSGGKQTLTWRFSNVTRIVPEPSMPPVSRVSMRLLFSTLSSWKAVSRWYFNLVEPRLKPSAGIVKKVKELTSGDKDRLEKLSAIFYFVAQKIRYMGITEESNRPGFEPHDVTLTFNRRYGVCRDKAALLVSMLRIAGFNAVPVLVSVGRKLDREIPVPYFNHAIAAVLDDSGRPEFFLDPTSETSKQFLPDYERDCSCLIADEKGADLGLTPAQVPERNLTDIQVTDLLNEDGSLSGRIRVVFRGFADTAIRSYLMMCSEDERLRSLKRFISSRRPGIDIENVVWSDPGDRSISFSFSCNFVIRQALRHLGQEETLFFPLSNLEAIGILDKWVLGKANMAKRHYPIRLGYTFASRITETVDLGGLPGRIVLPSPYSFSDDILGYTTTFSIEGTRLTIKKAFSLRQMEVSPERYREITMFQYNSGYFPVLPIVMER